MSSDFGIYAIVATTAIVDRFVCFSWRGRPQAGIERAKREAVEFGMTDLYNFRAEYVGPALPLGASVDTTA